MFDLKNRREIGRIRSTNSEADEATDVEPNSSLPNDPALSPLEQEELEDDRSRKATNSQNGSKGYVP